MATIDDFTEVLDLFYKLAAARGLSFSEAKVVADNKYLAGSPGTHSSFPDTVPYVQLEQRIETPHGAIRLYQVGKFVPVVDGFQENVLAYQQEHGIVPLRQSFLGPVQLADMVMDVGYTLFENLADAKKSNWHAVEFRMWPPGYPLHSPTVDSHKAIIHKIPPEQAFNILLDLVEGKRTLSQNDLQTVNS